MSADSLEMLKARSAGGLARPVPTARPAAASPDPDEEECQAFGFLRGVRDQALCLELRYADGNSESHAYSWLGPVKHNPSAGLLLKFVGDLVYLVLLEGSNLNALVNGAVSLYSGIQRHRVTWVRELTRQQVASAGDGEVTVERIRTLSCRPDEEPKGVDWLEPFAERS